MEEQNTSNATDEMVSSEENVLEKSTESADSEDNTIKAPMTIKERITAFFSRYRAVCAFAGASAIILLLIVTEAKQLRLWKEENKAISAALESVEQEKTRNTSLSSELSASIEEAQEEGKDLDATIAELEDIKEQLMQGAAYQLTQIQEAFDKAEWQNVIAMTAKLHEDHPDASEGTAADELALASQAKLDEIAKAAEEEAARKKAEEEEAARQKEEQAAAKKQQDEEKKRLSDLKNKDMYTVLQTIDELGYTATFYNTTFEWIDGEKWEGESRETFRDSTLYPEKDLKEYWRATKIFNINTSDKTVDIDYIGEEPGAVTPSAPGSVSFDDLNKKLEINTAWSAAEFYGESLYPYGFNINLLSEGYTEEPYNEDTWYLKSACTIKNAYGTKQKAHMEAWVSGTTDNPKVVDFNVY